jgi:Transposase IS116/IS110/IS902 family
MPTIRFARTLRRLRWPVVVAWLIAVVFLFPLANSLSGVTNNSNAANLPASAPSTRVIALELQQASRQGPGHCAALPGVGDFTALVMLAEIGDISRFGSARKLASWAGLTPTVRGSDLDVRHVAVGRHRPVPSGRVGWPRGGVMAAPCSGARLRVARVPG